MARPFYRFLPILALISAVSVMWNSKIVQVGDQANRTDPKDESSLITSAPILQQQDELLVTISSRFEASDSLDGDEPSKIDFDVEPSLRGYRSIAHAASRNDDLPPFLASLVDPTRVIVLHHGFSRIDDLSYSSYYKVICKKLMDPNESFQQNANHSTIIDVSFNCHQQFQDSVYGTGNLLITFYAMRAAAHALGSTDVTIHCDDADNYKHSLILPWVMGIFPRIRPGDPEAQEQQPDPEQACGLRDIEMLGWVWNEMRFEMRRMAIAMVGIPSPDHPSASWAEKNLWPSASASTHHRNGRDYMQLPNPKRGDTPLHPDARIDDAVLHFRCGDLVDSDSGQMGFMKFGSYSRYIAPNVRSIGIVTQPFQDEAQSRKRDGGSGNRHRCRIIVEAFVNHLQDKFPTAVISVHNSVNETIALAFARMIMANQTVIGMSTFGNFPALSTFGTSYIQHNPGDFNGWFRFPPVSQRLEKVTLIEEPMLLASEFRNMWGQDGSDALAWLNE